MPILQITTDIEATPWTDLESPDREIGTITRVGLLPRGMASGRPTLSAIITMRDSTPVVGQTSWAMMRNAVAALGASPVAEADRERHPHSTADQMRWARLRQLIEGLREGGAQDLRQVLAFMDTLEAGGDPR